MTTEERPSLDVLGNPPLVRAAQYIRMSTEHQQYSTENQSDVIRDYARRRGYEIVTTYADEGKSGLRIESRASLQQLLADVEGGDADFAAVLVYDVSRWGRFQDTDESAYYEYCCKRAGIAIHYCSEQFENDGRPVSTIIKSVKRAMAAEYSRELSAKVFQGQCRLIELGYRQGGMAGFGLRRVLVDATGSVKSVLMRGEHKSLQTDRVILAPGPEEEQATVRWIYEQFVIARRQEAPIAADLNARGCMTDLGRPWTRATVNQVLTNEKYIGNNVYNRTSFKLKKKYVKNEPDMWIRADGAFQPIVGMDLFLRAREIIQERARRLTDAEMLAALRDLKAKHATISGCLIDETDGMPCSSAYRSRFGSLVRAYQLAGYTPDRDFRYLEVNRALRNLYPTLLVDLEAKLGQMGASVQRDPATDLLMINNEFSALLAVSRSRRTPAGSLRWRIKIDTRIAPDITILVRMDGDNTRPADFYLLPMIDVQPTRTLLCQTNGLELDTYQFDDLNYFTAMATRTSIEAAA